MRQQTQNYRLAIGEQRTTTRTAELSGLIERAGGARLMRALVEQTRQESRSRYCVSHQQHAQYATHQSRQLRRRSSRYQQGRKERGNCASQQSTVESKRVAPGSATRYQEMLGMGRVTSAASSVALVSLKSVRATIKEMIRTAVDARSEPSFNNSKDEGPCSCAMRNDARAYTPRRNRVLTKAGNGNVARLGRFPGIR